MARTAVEGYLSGLHRSLFHGFGTEFLQYRAYTPGEDPRFIDWKAFARRDRLQTKVYQEETNMNCYLVLDASGSLDYRGSRAPCSKFRYATMVTACLAYLAARQGDNVGFYAYSDQMKQAIPPGHRANRLASVYHSLASLKPAGSANHTMAQDYMGHQLRGRGLVVFISDMLDGQKILPSLLSRIRIRHYDTVALQILDPDETDFPKDSAARFVDLESNAECVTCPRTVAETYNVAMQEMIQELRQGFSQTRVDFHQLSTEQNIGLAIAAYLHHRQQFA